MLPLSLCLTSSNESSPLGRPIRLPMIALRFACCRARRKSWIAARLGESRPITIEPFPSFSGDVLNAEARSWITKGEGRRTKIRSAGVRPSSFVPPACWIAGLALRQLLQPARIDQRDKRAIDFEQARGAKLINHFSDRLAVGVDHLGELAV